jgi:hypothetical protein
MAVKWSHLPPLVLRYFTHRGRLGGAQVAQTDHWVAGLVEVNEHVGEFEVAAWNGTWTRKRDCGHERDCGHFRMSLQPCCADVMCGRDVDFAGSELGCSRLPTAATTRDGTLYASPVLHAACVHGRHERHELESDASPDGLREQGRLHRRILVDRRL